MRETETQTAPEDEKAGALVVEISKDQEWCAVFDTGNPRYGTFRGYGENIPDALEDLASDLREEGFNGDDVVNAPVEGASEA